MGEQFSAAAARGKTLDPNFVAGAIMCENEFISCAFFTDAAIVSARESDWFVFMIVDIDDGTVDGLMFVFDNNVIGPE